MARALFVVLSLLTLLTSGCVSNSGAGSDADVASTPSPERYDGDPDKPKRVCESTTEGTEAKTICY